MKRDVVASVARGVRAPRRVALPAALLLLLLGLQGCGQKGPLTLPPADTAASAAKR